MKAPKIEPEVGGYCLGWESGLRIRIKRLDVHSDGRVTGFLSIRNQNGTGEAILLSGCQFNFSSETVRARHAKDLAKKYESLKYNWIEIFDYLGDKVQDLATAGEGVSEVWLKDDVEAPELLLPPFIYSGVSNIIYGEKGVKKSTFAYLFAVIMALPWDDNPLELHPVDRTIKTLVCDWETDQGIFAWYLSRLKRGMHIPECSIFYHHCQLSLADELESIERHAREVDAKHLVIDSLAAAAGGNSDELKGSSQALQFNTALRKLGLTYTIIAQTSKSNEEKQKTIYGSTLFTYYARNIFEICRPRDDTDSDVSHAALFHRENNFGRKSAPIGFRIQYGDNYAISVEREPVSMAEFSDRISARVKILQVLIKGLKTAAELVDGTGASRNTVDQTLKRLRGKGQIVKVGDKWGLASVNPGLPESEPEND